MRRSSNEETEEQVLGKVPISRPELLALIEALSTFISSSSALEKEVQDRVIHLRHSLEQALLLSTETCASTTFNLSRDELLLLTLAAATITVPYRTGIAVPSKDQPFYATLSPLVERFLALVEQIRWREFQALRRQREQAS
jgi:hypothetical protein